MIKHKGYMPTKNQLAKMCKASPGCLGFEWCNPTQVRLVFKEESADMFDLWFDSGAKVLGEAPMKANEVEHPYLRYLLEWSTPPPAEFSHLYKENLCHNHPPIPAS